jgi:diguanylate cyclase
MARPLSVLIVEDSEDDELFLLMSLRQAGFDPLYERVQNAEAMAAALDAKPWQLVISDHNMPDFSAPEALALLRSKGLDTPFIIVSGSIGEEAAVTAMKAGAQDFLMKGQLARLPAAVERELRDAVERRARQEAEQKIRFLAYFDPLTSLPNRANFCEQLTQQLGRTNGSGGPLAILGVKLDNLREINNTLGYNTGQRVLAEVAARLHRVVRAPRVIARVGGAEFAVLLPGENAGTATRFADELQAMAAGTVMTEALEVEPTLSFGVTEYPSHGDEPEVLLQHANVALMQAAESPRRIATYDADVDPFQQQRLSMISDLRRAIAEEQLRLHYQPKVRFSTGALVGVEALVRWTHPRLGVVRPDQFIPLAEQTGLINPLTQWVLKEAMRQSSVWRREGLDLGIAINFSARNLHSSELSEHLGRLLSAPGATADRLILEVTESAIMSDDSRAQHILRRLHDQGVAIAIDDFGTGYSSLAHLRRLPVSEIKIDKSFVIGMAGSSEDGIIVDSIIELGHKLGLRVVAEGVESLSLWRVLSGLHCDLAQGYFLSRPLPADDVLPWTRSFVPPAAPEPPRAVTSPD